uniref:Iron-binding zinc finger CDGSH type domain-containing protein n=1 Tax=Periophthalmus magnuspinnatus TaxID=409849 RepID=A0A3B4AHB1_9GOBI
KHSVGYIQLLHFTLLNHLNTYKNVSSSIGLDIVAVNKNIVKLKAGKRYAWCACGHSQKQPFCDGTHRAKAPNIEPMRFTAEKNQTVLLCACKQTRNGPYCDGTHIKVIFNDVVNYVKRAFKK